MSMRQGGQNRRSRNGRSNGKRPFNSHGGGGGGGGGGGQGGGLNRSFESNGPGVKLRGTAAQVYDKYLALARDAQILCTNGYRFSYAQPFDMFPQTHHVETVALFERL